jgi:hypothetical protein
LKQEFVKVAKKTTLVRRITRWIVWLVVVLLALFALQVGVLAFPQIALHNRVQVGAVILYHDGGSDEAMRQLATDVDGRLRGCRFYDSTRVMNLYYFLAQGTYEFFTSLTFLRGGVPQGFNLPELNNSYVSDSLVAALGRGTSGRPKYSIWGGDPAHTAAHEIGHQYSYELLGRRKLPQWKQEGLPEYIANIGLLREDSLGTLDRRIGIVIDDSRWWDTPPGRRPGWARMYYEAGVLVEYLFEVEGRTLEDIMADSITKDATDAAMMKWYESQRKPEETM